MSDITTHQPHEALHIQVARLDWRIGAIEQFHTTFLTRIDTIEAVQQEQGAMLVSMWASVAKIESALVGVMNQPGLIAGVDTIKSELKEIQLYIRSYPEPATLKELFKTVEYHGKVIWVVAGVPWALGLLAGILKHFDSFKHVVGE